MPFEVTSADRIVYPAIGLTKGEVVAAALRLAPRVLPHVAGRPLSLRRFPRGLGAPGFFQKNVPPHYPATIRRFEVARSAEAARRHPRKAAGDPAVTVYPIVDHADDLGYLANQGAIELHVGNAREPALDRPDRLILDLDPPAGAVDRVRRAAFIARDGLAAHGLASAAVATGSKGYHVVAPIAPTALAWPLVTAMQQLAALLEAAHPDALTTAFRIARRGERVFLDWLRNEPGATVVAPYSLRATPRATIAAPLDWDEVESVAPDGFAVADLGRLLDRPDPLAERAANPGDPVAFIASVEAAFAASGLELVPFDRFRS